MGEGLHKGIEKLGMEHLQISTPDFQGPDMPSTVRAVELMRRHVSNPNGKVYVHCNAGRGRSAVVAASYLLANEFSERRAEEAWDPAVEVKQAVQTLRKQRPQVTPNLVRYPLTGQARALRAFAATEAPRLGNIWKKRL